MISNLAICPNCNSKKFAEVKPNENRVYSLNEIDSITGRPINAFHVTLYGCGDCGVLTLQSKNLKITED